jgi:hypothetical protein
MLGVEIAIQEADRSEKEAKKAMAKNAAQAVDDDDDTSGRLAARGPLL